MSAHLAARSRKTIVRDNADMWFQNRFGYRVPVNGRHLAVMAVAL